jgi:hypothetical protein
MFFLNLLIFCNIFLLIISIKYDYDNERQLTNRNQPVRFILLHSIQHSGTHFFRSTLLQQPGLLFFDEICTTFQFFLPELPGCLDKLKYAFQLPDNTHKTNNTIYLSKHMPNCAKSNDINTCFNQNVLSSRAVGMILQLSHGLADRKWMENFVTFYKHYYDQYKIDIKFVILYRVNLIAHQLASSGNIILRNEHVSASLILDEAQHYEQRMINLYYALLKSCHPNSPIFYVTYEHLLQHHETFYEITKFIGISSPHAMNVTEETKHHTNTTLSYVSNLAEVLPDLYFRKYPLLQLCMLFDDCARLKPSLCVDFNITNCYY